MNDKSNASEKSKEIRTYLIGLGWAIGLSAVAFATVYMQLSRTVAFLIVGICAIAQFVTQLRYFFHIDETRQNDDDLQLILFSTLLLIIMVAGSIWVMTNLNHRMVPTMPM